MVEGSVSKGPPLELQFKSFYLVFVVVVANVINVGSSRKLAVDKQNPSRQT